MVVRDSLFRRAVSQESYLGRTNYCRPGSVTGISCCKILWVLKKSLRLAGEISGAGPSLPLVKSNIGGWPTLPAVCAGGWAFGNVDAIPRRTAQSVRDPITALAPLKGAYCRLPHPFAFVRKGGNHGPITLPRSLLPSFPRWRENTLCDSQSHCPMISITDNPAPFLRA